MTALCSGGTSSPKPGVQEVLIYTSGAASLIPIAGNYKWLIPFLPLLGNLTFNTPTFCASDPPAVSALTPAEILACAVLQFGSDYESGIEKLGNYALLIAWYALCKCDSMTTPAIPTSPTPPNPLPVFPDPPKAGPCVQSNDAAQGDIANGSDVDQVMNPSSGSLTGLKWGPHPGTGGDNFPNFDVTTLRFTLRRNSVGAGPHSTVTWSMQWQSRTAVLYTQTVQHAADGVDHVYDFAPPAGATNVILQYFTSAVSTDTVRAHVDGYCGTAPGSIAPNAGCCPPDPHLIAMLRELSDSVMQLSEDVTLIQRQAVPFAYVYGANHAGLVDDGEFAVTGLLGVSVDVTTLPASYGRAIGTPERLYELGYVTLGTADGWLRSASIDHDGTIVLPTAAGVFTRVGYTLSPGVVVAIRELIREP